MILDYVDEKSVVVDDGQEAMYQELASRMPAKVERYGDWELDRDLYRRSVDAALLRAEQQELRRLEKLHNARAAVATVPIELGGLLSMRRKDGTPLWALVNPGWDVDEVNGSVIEMHTGAILSKLDGFIFHVANTDGYRSVFDWGSNRNPTMSTVSTKTGVVDDLVQHERSAKMLVPVGGFPAIPRRVRDMYDKLKSLCHCVAILYQPLAWGRQQFVLPSPDPALLVRHDDRSPFRCAAVWGHDGALIKEFTS